MSAITAVQASAASAGLVSLSTSRPPTDAKLDISTNELRIQKLRRALKKSAELMGTHHGCKSAMLTLTYAKVDQQNPKDVSNLLSCIKKYLNRRGHQFRYVWVGELQGRGALHYHVLIWLPRGVTLPKPDKRGWWPHGSTNIGWARKSIGYLLKYASKLKSKALGDENTDPVGFPKGFRIHGSGGLEPTQREARAHHMLPSWMRNQSTPDEKIRRAVGGGFVSKITGEWFKSPWKLTGFIFVPGVGPIVTVRNISIQEQPA